MTVKTELERLKNQRGDLEKERSQLAKQLEKLISERNSLEDKRKDLSGKTSTLAQKLQHENKISLELQEKDISKQKEALRATEEQLKQTQTEIDARENDATLYIQEQVHIMIPQLLDWIARNKETIGYDIKRRFRVAGVVRREVGRHGGYYYPIGNMGIFEDEQETDEIPIVCSNDFYFQ